MSTTVNGVGGMRLVHPKNVSGDLMVMGLLDQAREKKKLCESLKSAARVGWRSEHWSGIHPLTFTQLLWRHKEYEEFAVIYQAKTEKRFEKGKCCM